MTTIPITKARANLYSLVDLLQEGGAPVVITAKNGNAVLIAEDEWRSIAETLHLLSIPGMKESIITASREPLDSAASTIDL